jgi:hypothetical protein
MHTFIINTILLILSLQHISALKGPASGSATDIFRQQGQQNELPDIKFSLMSTTAAALAAAAIKLEEIFV